MCGHFAINYMKFKSLIDRYGLEIMPIEEIESIFNDAHYYPSHGDSHTLVPVVLETPQGRKLDYFRWDIVPAWWNKPLKEKKFSSFNARSESLMENSAQSFRLERLPGNSEHLYELVRPSYIDSTNRSRVLFLLEVKGFVQRDTVHHLCGQ